MSMRQWLYQLSRRLSPNPSQNNRSVRRRASVSRHVRLNLEGLEDRLVPSADLVKVAAVAPSAAHFSENQQNVTLTANVTDDTNSATKVNEGTVTFTVKDSSGTTIGSSVQGTVSNGSASATFALPAGKAIGTYTIDVGYTDSAGSFTDDGADQSSNLMVSSTSVLVKANNASASFSTSSQTVTLTASVTDPNNSSDIVNEGTVTFTVKNNSGTTIGSSVQGTVSNGTATASFTLPANTSTGSYTIDVSYSDSPADFTDNGTDTSGTLSVSASTTTTASNATATFESTSQIVTLSATVTSSDGTVNEGSVTFTILQGSTTIGTATSGTVSDGSVSVSYSLPASTSAGTYTIEASYTDSSGSFASSSDNTHTLTVNGMSTTTSATSTTATFSTSSQDVTLTATVTSSSGTVTEGTVTFTILNSSGTTIGTATSGTISSGSVSVSYALPGDTAAGSYTIKAAYSDTSGKFASSTDTSHTLTIDTATTTTAASDATISFSGSAQDVTLTATVTSSAGTVDEGTVTFSLLDSNGNTVGTSKTSGTISNGTASVSFALPAGTAAGTYTIDATYNAGSDFGSSSDSAHSLTVNAATGTSVTLTSVSITPDTSNSTAQVTLTATVSNSAGTVNEGSVTFTMDGVSGQGNVSNGTVSVTLTVSLQSVIGDSIVSVSYSDNATSASFRNGSSATSLFLNIWNGLSSSDVSFASDGTELNQMQGSAQSLGFAYSTAGLLTQITVSSVTIPVTYTNVAGNVLVTIEGVPWQLNFFDSNGQFQGLQSLAIGSDGSLEWLDFDAADQLVGSTPV